MTRESKRESRKKHRKSWHQQREEEIMDEKTMNQRAIKKLEEELKQSKEELAAHQKALDLLKDAEATPFAETKVARGFFHTVKFLTSPFAKLHKVHTEVLKDPQGYRREKLAKRADTILAMAVQTKPEDKKAKGMAVVCGKVVIQLEEEERRAEWPEIQTNIVDLRNHVERLRPVESKEKREEMREALQVVGPGEPPQPQPV
jgi:vacuolar-type H+-ATPase subunit I/STV1